MITGIEIKDIKWNGLTFVRTNIFFQHNNSHYIHWATTCFENEKQRKSAIKQDIEQLKNELFAIGVNIGNYDECIKKAIQA